MASSVPRYSNAKHWCALCRTFIQNDPKSIRHHEQGLRHLGVVKRQLLRAARTKDLATSSSSVGGFSSGYSLQPKSEVVEELQPIEVRPDEVLGQYVVRGVVYLQGEYHEDLLLMPSSTVQLSLVDEEGNPGSWISCQVQRFDPDEKAYVVEFRSEEQQEESVHVESRDLRVIGPQPPATVSNWVQVDTSGNEPSTEVAEVLSPHHAVPNPGPTIEFYKGVALVDEDDRLGLLERQKPGKDTAERPKVVEFRKRARPAN